MSKTSQAAQTAYGPTIIAAVEQIHPPARRLLDDSAALAMLPASYRLIVRACGWGWLRAKLQQASESKAPGIWAGVCVRKRLVEDCARRGIADGVDQVVILGAGLDALGMRLASSASVFELDLPSNMEPKRARIESQLGEVPPRLKLLSVDFESTDVAAALRDAGFDMSRPAVFVWEAVTQYLTEAGARSTMSMLADAASGSRLVFTYVRAEFIAGEERYGSEALYEDLVVRRGAWTFGLRPSEVESFVGAYGWSVVNAPEPSSLEARFVAPTSRALKISELERCVEARKV